MILAMIFYLIKQVRGKFNNGTKMKMYEDTNVHCLHSFHDKVWTNEMESKM